MMSPQPPHSQDASNTSRIIAEVIRTRRTIGSFRPELPPRDQIISAIEVARWAPNHKKTEPWQVKLLGPQTIQNVIDLNTRIVEMAKGPEEAANKRSKWSAVPGWLVVACDIANDPLRREEDYAATCCFIQNLSLSLWSFGIGTKWTTGDVTRHDDFVRLMELDRNRHRIVGLFWYGYPSVVPEQTRKPVDQFLSELP
jgi:nitroreductase